MQQTKMVVTCQRFGDLFLFGLVWQYSSVQTKYDKNKGMLKVMAILKSRLLVCISNIKFMSSKKATKIDEIFTVDLTATTYCQRRHDGEDFVNFCGLLRIYELYYIASNQW